MEKRVIYIISLLALALLLSSCGGGSNYETDNVAEVPIHRFVDREAGVVCFWFSYTRAGGIDCLPISETRLGQ